MSSRKSTFNLHPAEAGEAGVDEAGRGCLAGPVVAAAVMLPPDFHHPLLNDSKKMSAAHRGELRVVILEKALAYGIGMASAEEIDQINILQATYLAMHRAIQQLKLSVDVLLIDGNRFKPFPGIPYRTVIGGDGLHLSIAAASVLAKTERDLIMENLHEQFPHYAWNKNKGYGTAAHCKAIEAYGYVAEHRKSFKLKSQQLSLF